MPNDRRRSCAVRLVWRRGINSPEEARAQIHYQYRYFYPQTEPEFIEEV
ncbi:hypothetical protein ACNKHT_18020 [Shigella flexneri]